MGVQSRVVPDQRAGYRARAWMSHGLGFAPSGRGPPLGPGLHIARVQADIRMGTLFRATIPLRVMVLAELAVHVLIAVLPSLPTRLPAFKPKG